MSKAAKSKPSKTKPEAGAETAAPRKRSKVKLALIVLAPLLVAGGGGYAGWVFFLAPQASDTAHAGDAHGGDASGHGGDAHAGSGDGHGKDPVKVAALPLEVVAETSATHSLALATLIAAKCGSSPTPALLAASQAEAEANGMLVNLSWMAAARRTGVLSPKNCGYLRGEVEAAEAKAEEAGAPAPAETAHH